MTPIELDPQRDYPLASNRPELLKTPTGKRLDQITVQAVLAGDVAAEDLRIAPDTLRLQAQIAESAGRAQLGQNFRRAAELTALPDQKVLSVYNALRPHASTKQQLLDIAEELERDYSATLCGRLVREAADVYERRRILAS
jgi:propanediol dehydratase small subunit